MEAMKTAKKIVERLNSEGHIAYFAGGWVRDYLMGHPSSDIDIATDAAPERIVALFKKTIPVGISFGVVIVVMNGRQFEVSTFRKDLDYADGRRPKEIALSDAREDALRRDFTINGMFYDPEEEVIIDYVGGKEDIRKGLIRTIGDPAERFREDRLRMLRAVRFAYRFGFHIEESTREAIASYAELLLPAVSVERIWQELKKMAEFPTFGDAVEEMHRLGLLAAIFPALSTVSVEEVAERAARFRRFPHKCPTILYIAALFPSSGREQLTDLCRYLKVKNSDLKAVEFYSLMKEHLNHKCEDAVWARLYAHPLSELAIQVLAAQLPNGREEPFLNTHRERLERLSSHVERIRMKSPLVTAADLKKEGIAAGRRMGEILAEAERLAINKDICEKNTVLEELKRTRLWKE